MAASRLWLGATWRDWSERIDVSGAEWRVGRGPRCEIQVRHPSVAPEHAQLMLRRGALIVRPLGRSVVQLRGAPIRAPVVVERGASFTLGEVELRRHPPAGPSRARIVRALGPVRREWAPQGETRRFDLEGGGEGLWAPRAPNREASPVDEGWAWAETRPAGVRLESVLHRLEAEDLSLPPEVAVVIAAQVGEALVARGRARGPGDAHGALGPRAVHLGVDGEVLVLPAREGAGPDARLMSPERRYGEGKSRLDDAFTYASLCVWLIRVCGAPPTAWAPLTPLLQSDPRRRSVDIAGAAQGLRRGAEAFGLDGTARHVAAPVRLLLGERARPLLRESRVQKSGPLV